MLEALSTIPPLVLTLLGFAFLGGIATVPILAYGLGDILPGVIAEPLAQFLFVCACFGGMSNPALEQTETGEYVITEGDPDAEPEENRLRFAWTDFGITARMTDEAWQTLSVDPAEIETEPDTSLPDDYAAVPALSRGGKNWCMQLGKRAAFALPIGQVLSVFQNSAGLDLAVDAAAQGEKEHGGDTSSFSPKMRLIGAAFFSLMGFAMGGFIFFL